MTQELRVSDPVKIQLIMDALKAYNIPQHLSSAYDKPGDIPMGGEQPPAVTMNKPVSSVTDNLGMDYPPKGDKTMSATQKQMGGERLSVPEADTVPSNIKSEEAGAKPSKMPGDVHDTFPTAVGSDASTVTNQMGKPRTSLTPGSGDKGTFSATNDPKDTSGSALPGTPFKGEEDEEGKAFRGVFNTIKAYSRINKARAKMMLEDAMSQFAAGQDAKSVLEEIQSKIEELLGGGQAMGATNASAQPAPTPQSAATLSEAGMGGGMGGMGTPAMSAPAPSPSPSMGAGMGTDVGTEEDMEAYKALKSLGEKLAKGEITFKQYDDAISSVFQPKGGSDNFTNLRTPGQPPGKIAASPGRSGSSEVFRTVTGSKGGVGMTRDAQLNPAATLETAQDKPIATYEVPTSITSGPGYQMDILRELSDGDIRKRGLPRGNTNLHPSLTKFYNLKSNEEVALGAHSSQESVSVIPSGMEFGTTKFLLSSAVPSKEQLAEMARNNELDPRLLQKAEVIPTEDPSKKDEGVLMKGLRKIVDSA